MQYHINTGLIYAELKKDCECPLCSIEKIVDEQFINEYLNDAVCDDDARKEVNAYGFCAEHYEKMFKRPNKLSLALQIFTRLKTVRTNAGIPKDAKSALKTSESILNSEKTCIICKTLDYAMTRYYMGIADLFTKDPAFSDLLLNSKGFCLHHYAKLLEYAKYAGDKQKQYVAVLAETQEKALDRMTAELKWFCDKHDYRNRTKPLGTSQDIIPRMYKKLYGKDLT